MASKELKPILLVDSTHRIRWEITKDQFNNCSFPSPIFSPNYAIDVNGEEVELYLMMFPKGIIERWKNNVEVFLCQLNEDKKYKVRFQFAVETPAGYWPYDFVKDYYSRKSRKSFDEVALGDDIDMHFCTTEEFEKQFVNDKITTIASFVIYVEGDNYRDHMEVVDNYVEDMRSMSSSSQNNLSDFTIISGNKRFLCHRILLSVRSEYFEALFRNEPSKRETIMEEPPEFVKTMLKFMCKGIIPNDINKKAEELIFMSDKYGLDLLTLACETSLVNNLTPENAVHTLIKIDNLKHVSKFEHRQRVLDYIKKEADLVVKTEDWKKFVQTYPDLITEILLHFRKVEVAV